MTTTITGQPVIGVRRFPPLVYWTTLVGVVATVLAFAPQDPLATVGWLFVTWLTISILTLPGMHRAGTGLIGALSGVLVIRNYPELTTSGRIWALLAIGACASAFVLVPLRKSVLSPILHLFCLYQGVYLYVGAFVATPSFFLERVYPPEVRSTGLQYSALFVAVVVVVAVGVDRLLLRAGKGVVLEKPRLGPDAVQRTYALMATTGMALIVLTQTGVGGSLGLALEILQMLFVGTLLIMALLWLDKRLAWHHRIVVVGATLLVSLLGLGTGALFQLAIPAMGLLGLYVSYVRRVPWVPFFLAVVIAIGLNVGKGDYRQDVKAGVISGSQTELGVSYLDQSASNFGAGYSERYMTAAHRFSNSDLLGYMVTWVPERYEYYGTEPYERLPLVLVPRVLYPFKGTFNYSNEIGRQYELIGRSDFVTSVNTPVATEAWVTGGPLVFGLIAVLTGSVLSLLGWLLRRNRAVDHVVTGLMLVIAAAGAVESGFLSIFVAPVYALVLITVLRRATGEPSGRVLAAHAAAAMSRNALAVSREATLRGDRRTGQVKRAGGRAPSRPPRRSPSN